MSDVEYTEDDMICDRCHEDKDELMCYEIYVKSLGIEWVCKDCMSDVEEMYNRLPMHDKKRVENDI